MCHFVNNSTNTQNLLLQARSQSNWWIKKMWLDKNEVFDCERTQIEILCASKMFSLKLGESVMNKKQLLNLKIFVNVEDILVKK